MNLLSPQEETKVFQLLLKEKCCARCCLRFLAVRKPEAYQNPFSYAENLGYTEENSEIHTKVPCVVCLGILQDETQSDIIEKITAHVNIENYDCESFSCALTVPSSVTVRERSLCIYLQKTFEFSENTILHLRNSIQSVKDVWRWIFGQYLESNIKKQLQITIPSPLLVEICFAYQNEISECSDLLILYKKNGNNSNQKKRRSNQVDMVSRKSMETFMSSFSDTVFCENYAVPPTQPQVSIKIENISCSHSSIFVGGRYNKFSRALSQTPWFVDGEKKMETSVQDILCDPIVSLFEAQSLKFLSSGREDVDVRNIYSGRPFAVELINPKKTNITNDQLAALITTINQSSTLVQITSNLKILSRLDLKKLKEGENAKSKFYRALCVCRSPLKDPLLLETLNSMRNVEIIQKTPVRVLHRRPLTPRTRIVQKMRVRWVQPGEIKLPCEHVKLEPEAQYFILDIKVQAGTYIKEFVHGDFGRTRPNLCDLLGTEVDIVALDVTGINLVWP